jgi:hypothetical protein
MVVLVIAAIAVVFVPKILPQIWAGFIAPRVIVDAPGIMTQS